MSGKKTPTASGPAPTAGGPAEILHFERASATPSAEPAVRTSRRTAATVTKRSSAVSRRGAAARPAPAPAVALAADPGLDHLQRAFHGIITSPRRLTACCGTPAHDGELLTLSPEQLGLFKAADNLPVIERLDVYHYAYKARLIDCLADDYPTVKHALGAAAFDALCAAVIEHRPSRGPNLNVYGRALLDHCREDALRLPSHAFITELATLEWSMTEVFHAEAAATFSLEQLRAIPMEQWAAMTFAPSQTVRIHRFAYPVNAYLQAYRDEQEPPVPRAKASATAVYRMGFKIWRMDLTPPMAVLLEALFAGTALAPALDAMGAAYPDQPGLEASVMTWFSEWVRSGFFALQIDA